VYECHTHYMTELTVSHRHQCVLCRSGDACGCRAAYHVQLTVVHCMYVCHTCHIYAHIMHQQGHNDLTVERAIFVVGMEWTRFRVTGKKLVRTCIQHTACACFQVEVEAVATSMVHQVAALAAGMVEVA
jgi:hypothetical protein